jgi:hypothetical protein
MRLFDNIGLMRQVKNLESKIELLESAQLKLKAENWVLRDQGLRTYDGLAMKADKYDVLVKLVQAHIERIRQCGRTYYETDEMSVQESTNILKESLDELQQA